MHCGRGGVRTRSCGNNRMTRHFGCCSRCGVRHYRIVNDAGAEMRNRCETRRENKVKLPRAVCLARVQHHTFHQVAIIGRRTRGGAGRLLVRAWYRRGSGPFGIGFAQRDVQPVTITPYARRAPAAYGLCHAHPGHALTTAQHGKVVGDHGSALHRAPISASQHNALLARSDDRNRLLSGRGQANIAAFNFTRERQRQPCACCGSMNTPSQCRW